ncbi:uncharacterized protein BDZ83DRAFT_97162 [Colletotrichum acutatum]|uniref:Uncharacterized protein n=1 Tax=Glomerella acutata TaxID=27357 RepID=A0AAD8U8G1_GLOAC|nr:uncharacterized protein BDZ83DRAFT_97162 [Colletotrichum acutatum]KAK1712283.1 hypothetical protein BDZ83DRAFT_97162 [Colletotrichum acutatum]
MFSIGLGLGTSFLYLLFLYPNPPRDNRKVPKSGMAAQETSSVDTSPSSHALSSGPHVRASQRGAPSVARVLCGSSHFPLSDSTPQDIISGVKRYLPHGSLMDTKRSREKAVDDPLALSLARCPGHEHRCPQSAQQPRFRDR